MKSLREIIAKDGTAKVAERLGFSEAYMRHILTARRRAGERVLSKAKAAFGRRLSVERTIADNDRVSYTPRPASESPTSTAA